MRAAPLQGARFRDVRVHQVHAFHDRPYLHGSVRERLLHVLYFLSLVTRPAFHARGLELVPIHFSGVPRTLREPTKASLVVAAPAPLDRQGGVPMHTAAVALPAAVATLHTIAGLVLPFRRRIRRLRRRDCPGS